MTEPRGELERLTAALGRRPAGGDLPEADPGTVWDAVTGRLAPDEVAELARRALADPALMEEWRLALEISREAGLRGAKPERPSIVRRFGFRRVLLAAAAVLALVVAAPVLHHWLAPATARYRGLPESVIERAGTPGTLPRDGFVLRWRCTVPGSRFDIVVSDGRLHLLAEARGLTSPRYAVPSGALAKLPTGSRVLWQVWALTPDGRRLPGPTFVERLE